jgi:hypothetical protein
MAFACFTTDDAGLYQYMSMVLPFTCCGGASCKCVTRSLQVQVGEQASKGCKGVFVEHFPR